MTHGDRFDLNRQAPDGEEPERNAGRGGARLWCDRSSPMPDIVGIVSRFDHDGRSTALSENLDTQADPLSCRPRWGQRFLSIHAAT